MILRHDGFHGVVHLDPDFQKSGVFVTQYNWDRVADMREQQQVLLYAKVSLSSSMDKLSELAEIVLDEISNTRVEVVN